MTGSESVRSRFERGTLARLRALKWRIRAYVLVHGLAVVCLATAALVLITLGIDRSLRLDPGLRLVQMAVAAAIIGWLAWRRLIRPQTVAIRPTDLAALVERRHPELNGRLVSATEFAPAGGTAAARGSPILMAKVIEQADDAAARLRFADMLNHRRAARHATFGLAGLAIVVVLPVLAPVTMGLWFERNVMLRDVDWPVRNRLTVEGLENGKLIVPRGDDATVSAVVAPGFEPPRQVYIQFRGVGGLRGQAQMPEVRGRPVKFTHTFERVTDTLTCRIVGGDARTEPFTIEVIDRPTITGARIEIVPPRYTRLDPYELKEGQTVAEALTGSEIRLRVTTDQPIVSAILMRDMEGRQAILGPADRVSDREFVAADRPAASAAYHFDLTASTGLSNISPRVPPMRFTVRLDRDQAPVARMKISGAGEMITPQAVLPMNVEFSDVYGLATADIVFTSVKAGEKPVAEPLAGFQQASTTFSRSLEWSVADHALSEGDRLSLWAEAADFDDVSGPNVGRSPPAVFRIVSREELAADLNRRQHEYRQDFERVLRRQEDLYSELLSAIEPAAAEAGRRQRGQRLRQLARRQRDQAGQVGTIARQFEQILSEMRINGLATPDAEERLGRGVARPLRDLAGRQMPAAAESVDRLADAGDSGPGKEARQAQAAIRDEMNNILARMLEWERLEEAVILLRDVLNMQRNVGKETETTLERDIFGTAPASEPARQEMMNAE